jgi:hypothetical protein
MDPTEISPLKVVVNEKGGWLLFEDGFRPW